MGNDTPMGRKSSIGQGKRGSWWSTVASTVSFAIGVATVLVMSFGVWRIMSDSPEKRANVLAIEINALESRFKEQEQTIRETMRKLDSLPKAGPSTNDGTEMSAIRAQVEDSIQRITTLEKGLLESPEKALSVPLLRNDLENLRRDYREDVAGMSSNIDRVYDQNKWFIGLMFTMAIGLIGLAISNFLQARKKPDAD